MFKSIYYTTVYKYDNKMEYRYEIIDDDFVEIIYSNSKYGAEIVIDEYKKRNLNVAKNLFLFAKCMEGIYWFTGFNALELSPDANPYYQKYVDDVRKYMVLL